MTATASLVPAWAFVAATAALPFWFRAVRAVSEDPDAFYARCRTGSLLHGAVSIAILLFADVGKSDVLLAVVAITAFFTLFYVMCMRRDGVGDD